MHLLHQRRIPRESAWIQITHLVDQSLQLLLGLGTVLHRSANLVEEVQSLIDLVLRIGRIRTLLRRHRLPHDVRIAGVQIAVSRTTAIAAGIPHWTGLASAALPAIGALPALAV